MPAGVDQSVDGVDVTPLVDPAIQLANVEKSSKEPTKGKPSTRSRREAEKKKRGQRNGSTPPLLLGLGLAGSAVAILAFIRWRQGQGSGRKSNLTKAYLFLKKFAVTPPRNGQPLAARTFVVSESLDAGVSACSRLEEAGMQLEAIIPGPAWCEEQGTRLDNPRDGLLWHGGGEAASAAAVAAGLADVALTVDELGSSRIPAACCGVYCLRTSVGMLPLRDHAVPAVSLASLAVVVKDPVLLPRLVTALGLPKGSSEVVNYLVAVDLFAECGPAFRACLPAIISAVKRWAGADQAQSLSLAEWLYHRVASLKTFGSADETARRGEAAAAESHGPDVLRALRAAAVTLRDGHDQDVQENGVEAAEAVSKEASSSLLGALQEGYIFVLPTTPGPPPPASDGAAREAFQKASDGLAALAALAGVPQMAIPFTGPGGEILSVSLVTLHRKDAVLLTAAARLGPLLDEEAAKLPALPSATANGKPAPAPPSGSGWLPFGSRRPTSKPQARPKGSAEAADRALVAQRAERCKEAGNEAFKAGRYDEALVQYSQAVALDPGNAVYYNNRALVYLRMGQYGAAEDDAQASLAVALSAKALLRRGSARMALGEAEGAAADFEHVLRLEPNNRQAKEELRVIQRFLSTSPEEG